MNFASRLQYLCDKKGEKITPILKKLDISTGLNSAWKKGSMPNGENANKLAKYFDVSVDYLLYGAEDMSAPVLSTEEQSLLENYRLLSVRNKQKVQDLTESLKPKRATMEIPCFIEHVSAGKGTNLYSSNDCITEPITIYMTKEATMADHAVIVDGNSMLPDYADGDIVLLKQQKNINVGQIGIFVVNNDIGYIKKAGENELISINPDFDNIQIGEDDIAECRALVLGKAEIPE